MTKEEKKDLVIKGKIPESVFDRDLFRTIRALASYIGCIGITLAVTYFIDGTAGIILTVALICAFLLSLAVTLLVLRFITVSVSADKLAMSKGDVLTFTVTLSKSIALPAPIIEVYADCTEHLRISESRIYKGSVAGKERNVIKIPLSAVHSGACRVSISRVTVSDYLGIFSFGMKKLIPEPIKLEIYPDLPDAAVQTDFLKTTTAFSNDDEEEEETDETAIGSTGMPGYEHRAYVPGDPIKRINWKLSSKRDQYMVRLDEKIAGAGQMFFLDCPDIEENDFDLKIRDNVIEGALAVFAMIVKEGREASFFYPEDGLWLRIDIHSMGDVYRIQELMGGFKPDKKAGDIPPEITGSGKVPICFSAATNEASASVVSIVNKSPEALVICALDSGISFTGANFWTVSSEFELKKHNAV